MSGKNLLTHKVHAELLCFEQFDCEIKRLAVDLFRIKRKHFQDPFGTGLFGVESKMANGADPQEVARVLEIFKNRYNAATLPICSSCGTNDQVIPCLTGEATNDMLVYAQAGYAELNEGVEQAGQPYFKCKSCDLYINKPSTYKCRLPKKRRPVPGRVSHDTQR